MAGKTVKDIMSSDLKFCSKNENVFDVARLMKTHNVGCLLVQAEPGNKDSILGIVTDRDLVVKALAEGKDIRSTKISEIMTSGIETVSLGDDINTVKSRLASKELRRLGVMDPATKHIVGIVSSADFHASGIGMK